jgi:thymidylate synthase
MSNFFEDEYLDLLDYILKCGEHRADRTGTGTISLFAQSLRIDLSQGFPLLTTKKMGLKSILSELLWFIEGSGDERRLAEILHGTRDEAKKTIWSPNAAGTTGTKFQPEYPGDLGRIYGVQWRNWKKYTPSENGYTVSKVDQLAEVIHKLKNNPTDRRIILTAWNPGELDEMALPPCHLFCQFYLGNDNKLSCQLYQRSVDTALGLPYNIASYAALVHMIAHVCGYGVGELSMCLGDTHIYQDHIDGVKEQLTREKYPLPKLTFTRDITSIDDFKLEDFVLTEYQCHPKIDFSMSA